MSARRLLLDPRVLDTSTKGMWFAIDTLRRLDDLVRRLNRTSSAGGAASTEIVPFLAPEVDQELRQLRLAGLFRFLDRLTAWSPPTGDAQVANGPQQLEGSESLYTTWRAVLEAELLPAEEWRNPQLVTPDTLLSNWPRTTRGEVPIRAPRGTNAEFHRCVASIEQFDEHPHAAGDFDPWDLRHINPPEKIGDPPCRLPKPPECEGVRLDRLESVEVLGRARELGRERASGWLYVPGKPWAPPSDREGWRNFSAFERADASPGWQGRGWIDYRGDDWRWDRKERQWDVQLVGITLAEARTRHQGVTIHGVTPPYVRVGTDGRLL